MREISFVAYSPEFNCIPEVVDHDCYGVKSLSPFPEFVLDGGACFGAFSLLCWALGAREVVAVEPNPAARDLLFKNIDANEGASKVINVWNAALGVRGTRRHLVLDQIGHSYFGPHEGIEVHIADLPCADTDNSLLKLDVEGAERELFEFNNLSVISTYKYVVMEWHHGDGALYDCILRQLDFEITKFCGGDGTPWNPTLTGGLLTAVRR